MPTRYLEILAAHPPALIGTDTNARTQFALNFNTMNAGTPEAFVGEIGKLISDAGLGVKGSTLFVGREAKLPSGDGPYVTISPTGGSYTLETHNGDYYPRYRVQVMVTAAVYSAAETRATAIWSALGRLREQTVTGLP